MARPLKEGIDYFPLEVEFNDRFKLIEAEFGNAGFAVVVKLWQKIYRQRGYYCEWNREVALLFAHKNGINRSDEKGVNVVSEIVDACLRRGIFNNELYEKFHILTSKGIQKRYAEATATRDKVNWKNEYLLIPMPKNGVSLSDNSINLADNSQSKVKESKGKKSKVNISLSDDKDCSTNVQRIIRAWNGLADIGIPPISKISDSTNRYKMLNARLSKYGIDDVLKAIDNIRNSDFLKGNNKKGWIITFDWFVKPNNFPKVLENNYSSKKTDSEWQSKAFEL